MGRFDDQVVIVTGAGQGLGAACARKFVAEGATVILAGRTLAKVEKVASELGDKAIPWQIDVSKEEEWVKLTAYVKEKFGSLDVLVNNAAVMTYTDILHTSADAWKNIVDINLGSMFFGMKHCYEIMKKGVYRGIVNVLSTASMRVGDRTGNDVGYETTKAGAMNMNKHAALCFAPDCIRVNAVHPSAFMTPMLKAAWDAAEATQPGLYESLLKRFNPLPPYYGQPEEVADAILFLADSKAARMITGASLATDSGALLT